LIAMSRSEKQVLEVSKNSVSISHLKLRAHCRMVTPFRVQLMVATMMAMCKYTCNLNPRFEGLLSGNRSIEMHMKVIN
jgi:hypothetical protein